MKRGSGILVLALAAGLSGCSTSKPLRAWQERVEHYVVVEGGGNPASLRGAPELRSTRTLRPGQVVIGRLDAPTSGGLFAPTCDMQGVLLGTAEADGRRWCCFMVGQVTRRSRDRLTVDDVRLVGFAIRDHTWTWRATGKSSDLVEQYRAARADSLPADSVQCRFPAPEDVFEFEVNGDKVVARDALSRAEWTLDLAADAHSGSSSS